MGQQAHIANYATLENVELEALAEGRTKTAHAVAQRYGIKRVYRDHREMLAEAQLDAVVAILDFGLHATVLPDILETGLPLLTEKPLCINIETGRQLQKMVEQKRSIYHVGYMKRCDPASRLVRDTIAEWRETEPYGPITYLRVTMPPGDWTFQTEPSINLGDTADYGQTLSDLPPEWMDEKQGRQYWEFINYYIHQVNLIRYLLGEDYSVEYADPSGVMLAGRSVSGVPVVLEMATYTVADEWHEFYEAHFGQGRIRLSLPAPLARQRAGDVELYHYADGGAVYERPVIQPKWSMREQARLFVETVRTGGESLSPIQDAVKDLELAEEYIRRLCDSRTPRRT